MAYKINGTTVVDNSRNVCACCVTSCCITASSRMDAPSGNTASRPGSPATGSLYFDTDLGSLISYNGSDWAAVGGGIDHPMPLTFYLPTTDKKPHNSQNRASNCHVRCGKSAIMPMPNGGWDAFQFTDGASTMFSSPTTCQFTNLIQSNPETGAAGFVGRFNQHIPASNESHHFLGRYPGSILGHMEWGGMNPSSGQKNLYVMHPCFIGRPCNVISECTCCISCDRPLGYLDKDPVGGGPSVFLRKICICTNGCTYSNVKDPRFYALKYDAKAIRCTDQRNNGHVANGFHCCGFVVHSIGCHNCSAFSSLCCGGIYVIGGFKHEYFTTTDLCAPHTCKCMTWDFRCIDNYSAWKDFRPHYNPDTKTVWALIRKCGPSPDRNYIAIYCIGNADSCGYACTQCWCLCASPHHIRGGNCVYNDMVGGQCLGPLRSVYWCNQIWVMSPGQETRFYSIDCCNHWCTYQLCKHGSNPTQILGLGVDYEENLRVFSRCCCQCNSEMFETIIPRVAADCPGIDKACCVKVFKWCFKGHKCRSSQNRIAGHDFIRGCCGQVSGLSSTTKGLNFVEFENVSKRMAFNSALFVCKTSTTCSDTTSDSLLLDQIPYACETTLCWFCYSCRLCITRCFCGAIKCCGCNQSGCLHFCQGSSRTVCTQQYQSASCGCLPIHSNGGIGLCAGYDCVNPVGALAGVCCGGSNQCSGGEGVVIPSDTCYNVGY